jgi:hypothetical protein
MPHFKRKPASQIGAPISALECQQLKADFVDRFPGQVPAVFISREHILNSIAGISDLSGIHFTYGLNDANTASSRRIIMVPARNLSNGESGMVQVVSSKGYICDNGETIPFEKLMQLLGNHVTNFAAIKEEIPLSKLPRGYFWGIDKINKLLQVDECAGLNFHFGYNPTLRAACRQFQMVLEVVDADHNSQNVFMEYGQCDPPCTGTEGPTSNDCVATVAAEKFAKDADNKLNELRAFRDNWLLQQENGQALYELYYFLSRPLVAEIQSRANQEAIWSAIYHNGFSKCLELVQQNRYEDAKVSYVNLMNNLAKQFLVQGVTADVLI